VYALVKLVAALVLQPGQILVLQVAWPHLAARLVKEVTSFAKSASCERCTSCRCCCLAKPPCCKQPGLIFLLLLLFQQVLLFLQMLPPRSTPCCSLAISPAWTAAWPRFGPAAAVHPADTAVPAGAAAWNTSLCCKQPILI
jgi:hypothetical protein